MRAKAERSAQRSQAKATRKGRTAPTSSQAE
jgi:hypothetical protein